MRRVELDWDEGPSTTATGSAGGLERPDEDEHAPHLFLYIPDLASETGWAGHRVPERKPDRAERREMGFRR